METLIVGNGGHSRDIRVSIDFECSFISHHDLWQEDFRGCRVIIGVNDPRLRAQIAGELRVKDSEWVHPNAYVGNDCEIGYGSHVNYGASLVRTTIGRHCTISPGVTICGDVTIGDEVLIGAGATICDRVTIGSRAIIGAGAVVLPESDIYPGTTAIGVPARIYTGNHSPVTVGY